MLEDDEIDEWEDNNSTRNLLRNSVQQVQDYQNNKYSEVKNILSWWQVNISRFLLLSELVKYILAIPASSALNDQCLRHSPYNLKKKD